MVKLDAYIDQDDRLVVSFKEPGMEPILLRPERGFEDLVAGHEDRESFIVEVRDFVQCDTVYEVYCATLEDDGRTIAEHWKPTGAGQMGTFTLSSPAEAGRIKLFIGALPRRKDAPVPMPLGPRSASGSGPFPQEDEPPPHGG